MLTAIVVVSFALAAYAFFWGLLTEFRQSREGGPVALVATMPFGIASAFLTTIGTAALVGRELSSWVYILQFIFLSVVFVFVINNVSPRGANR
jgi:hypothetical protein